MKKKSEVKSIYLVGIKGMAMTGLAVMAKKLGYQVTGSDVDEVFPTDEVLIKNEIKFFNGFSPDNILNTLPDLVITSAAYGSQNPEIKAAKAKRISVIPQSEMLGKIISSYEGIGVAGVHGKTTTSSLVAFILKFAGFSPSYAIGASEIPGLGSNAAIGEGKYFVVEADEYKRSEEDFRPKFLDYPIKHAIITSIELDHPDVYETQQAVFEVFYQLAIKLPRTGTIIACSDWPLVRRLLVRIGDRSAVSYGFNPQADYQIVSFNSGLATTFSLKFKDEVLGPFKLNIPGKHNALNATAAIIMARRLGVSDKVIAQALAEFTRPERRFEQLGDYNGATVITDFAHHPTAIEYLLETARSVYPNKRVIAVFQPHTYSRTSKLLKEFAKSLENCDKLILLNIFASAREKKGYITIKDLAIEARKYKPELEYRSSLEEAAVYLKSTLDSNDLVLLIGAGDVYKIFEKLKNSDAID